MKKQLLTAAMILAGVGILNSAAVLADEQMELVVSHYYLEEERGSNAVGDSYLAMVEKWQEAHPEITLTQQAMSQADYSTKIQAQAAVNEMPDVFMVKGSWVDNFVDNDLMAPINDYLDQYEFKDNFKDGVFDVATRDGQIYGVPNQLSLTSIVYYNEDLWQQAGYDAFPDNWDDIFAAAEKFKEMGISEFSLGNKDKWPAESCLLSTIGDRYTGEEWTKSIIARDGEAKFTDENFVKALTLMQDLAKAGAFNPDFNTIGDTQAAEYYGQGLAAATVSGHWGIAAISSFADEEILSHTKVAILPNVDGSPATSISGGCGWYFAVSKELEGEKLDAAMEFVLRTTGYEMAEYATREHGLIGSGIVEDVDSSSFSQLTTDFIALMNGTSLTPVYDLQMDGAVIEVMNTGMQDLLNDMKTPEDLAAEIQAEQENL